MHHLYPLAKGDPLCPLGFHPQVRWPTRCKRCFRDYKEHGGKRKEEELSLKRNDSTSSSPNLNSWSIRSDEHRRSWSSNSNLTEDQTSKIAVRDVGPASWTSTPDLAHLEDSTQANIPTVSFTLPKRKSLEISSNTRSLSDSFSTREKSPAFNKSEHSSTRAKKIQAIKDASQEMSKRIQIKELKATVDESTNHDVQFLIQVKSKPKQEQFKSFHEGTESEDDTVSIAGTETTDTTLVGNPHEHEMQEQIDSLRQELDAMKTKCERLDREKSDLLLRRLASMETVTSKTTATEVLKLQQKCNELQSQIEDSRDEKKFLALRVKELEEDVDSRPTAQAAQKHADELRSKLLAAETLCEELMDENEDMKKELRDLEEEIEELQDNFREDQANEYTSLKKELEQTTKNCRILSFKLRKTERKTEQLEVEKGETEKKLREVSNGNNGMEKIKHLEQGLKVATETSLRLQKELDETTAKLRAIEETSSSKKASAIGNIPKLSSDAKVSRESLTRGGSQDDPAQILRDLHDSLEREADLREQLKFAEEELNRWTRKKMRPVIFTQTNDSFKFQFQTDHELKVREKNQRSLDVQNKGCQSDPIEMFHVSCQTSAVFKPNPLFPMWNSSINCRGFSILRMYQHTSSFSPMATLLTPIDRKGSPNRLTPEPIIEKDEGISEDDPTELKLLLELNDQEVSVLRKKVEELEAEKDTHKKKIKDLQDKLTTKTSKKSLLTSVKGQESQDKKLKVLEDETVNLKKQLAEKDKETERLSAELNLTQKRTKGMQKSKSLDIADPQSLDVKRQLQSIEQEAVVLRTKIQTLESENEKLAADNKRLQLLRNTKTSKSEKAGEKYIDRIAELEVELEYANKKVKELENSNGKHKSNDKEGENNRQKPLVLAKQFKDRIPKKPSEFTSKIQLKNMVKDLESEIGDILTALANAEGSKGKLEAELQELKSRSNNIDLTKNLEETKKSLIVAEKELQNVTSKYSQDRSKYDDLNNTLVKTKENLSSQLEEKKQIQNELSSFKDKHKTLEDQLRKQEKEVMRLTTELKNANAKQHEIIAQKGQIDDLSNDLAKKDKEYAKLKQDFDEKEKSLKDLTVAMKKLGDAEQLLRNNEDTMKKNDKQNKDQIKQLSAKLEEERERLRLKESQHLDLSTKWSADHKVFELQIEDLNSKIKSLEKIIVTKNTLIEQLEESVRKERENVTSTNLLVNNNEINSLKDELNKTKANLREVECKLETSSKGKKTADEKLRKAENEHKKEKSELDRKAAELSIELENEKKRYDTVKVNREREMKDKETELNALKGKIKTLESSSTSGNKQVSEIKKEYQERIDKLESKAAKDQQQYEDLTSKYEVLEEEYIVTKAKLVMEKETVSNQLKATKRDLDSLEFELQEVKETYSQKNEQLQKEKQQIAEKMKTLEKNCQKGLDTFGFERGRFKTLLEEKASDLDQIKKEYEVISDQLEYMRKENDDLKKKLDDYDKVSKIQRVISADTSAMEKEIKQLRGRLTSTEELRKSDLAECKLRYDSQVIAINEEIRSLQAQLTRFKRERDTYKHMLEGAQKTIGDLKASSSPRKEHRSSTASFDEVEEYRTKVASLEQQISCMEDELSEARLEASKSKTELVSERSSWEIKMSEVHSRVNELEEERILSSGRTKIPGLRTRMELAWHKEREEQQRLLQETSTLARDLRQTLFEVERERDKERLESKRKQEQIKKTLEEDQEENRRKLSELQCDLLELRDAHAKLRTTNEKLRREKERHEKEREELRAVISERKRSELDDDRRINGLLEQVEMLMKLTSGGESSENEVYTPTPPRRTRGSKSREASPTLERKDFSKESSVSRDDRKNQIQSVMLRLNDVTDELRRYQRLAERNRDRDRIKRTMGLRRATSTEHDNVSDLNQSQKELSKNGNITTNLHRRSLSLEHTFPNEQDIWRNADDSLSSLQSIDASSDIESKWVKRDASLDSRLSSTSTQSETGAVEKKKKGLIGKLKKLTKSRSIDDKDPGHFSNPRSLSSKPNSGSDVNEDVKDSKKDLKDRLTGIFKRGGSSSRSNSLERQSADKHDNRSTQRPLMPNGSNPSISPPSPVVDTVKRYSSKPTKYK
ncbi:trichohyalin-like isoform X1 [Photinus pyralis]|nr:trichohyalin-like isoform X1 [Photinus pyralis]XP_031337558.1 trichohyalin-like isoform X1 [Photinus pyralis]